MRRMVGEFSEFARMPEPSRRPVDPAKLIDEVAKLYAAEPDLEKAQRSLEDSGVNVLGPVHHEWMGATSLYFADPDGHELELLALVGSRA